MRVSSISIARLLVTLGSLDAVSVHADEPVVPLVPIAAIPAAVSAEGPTSVRVSYEAEWRASLVRERAARIAALRAYSQRGEFPVSTLPGLQFIFVSRDGARCAMAELMHVSGAVDLVDGIAGTDNAIQLATLTEGPAYEWILRSGLTMEEVQLIQEPGFTVRSARDLEREKERKRDHLRFAVRRLVGDTDESIERAIDRLGDRVYRLPTDIRAITLEAAALAAPATAGTNQGGATDTTPAS